MFCAAAMSLAFGACKKESRIEMNFPDKYEGKTVEVMNFADSTVLASMVITDGKASLVSEENDS